MDRGATAGVLRVLVEQGVMTQGQAEEILLNEDAHRERLTKARAAQKRPGRAGRPEVTLAEIVESLALPRADDPHETIGDEHVMRALAQHLSLPFVRIDPLKLDADVVTRLVSKPFAIKHRLVPVSLEGDLLTVATSDPFDREGIEGVKQSTGKRVAVAIATQADILKIVNEFYGFKSSVAAAHRRQAEGIDLGNLEQYVRLKSITELDASDKPIVNAVDYLLRYAYDQRASDIHIEPKRDESVVRFRIDGVLHVIHRVPRSVHAPLVSRIKGLARMDIAEKRRPQDGRIKTDHEGEEIELRVSTLPVAFGEKVVIRIFDPNILMQDIEALGMPERERKLFESFIAAPHGLILVTGPTGSGKTTTLYSALRALSTPDVNVTTVEDPIEMIHEGFNQTAVNPQVGITFAGSLRTLLRQDPDIIMVGEIRDRETAENAMQAALTGHLVLSTLHTNDAPSAVVRLLDLGIQPYLIRSTVTGIVAQRLVRRICRYCALPYRLSDEECRLLGLNPEAVKDAPVAIGAGCTRCRGTGYLGRTGVFEVIEASEAVREEITPESTPEAIERIARREGFTSLREGGIGKLLSGATTFDEVVRVFGIS